MFSEVHECAVSYVGATIDTKNALRTFLTSSSDFSSNAAAPVACTNAPSVSEVTAATSARSCPPPQPASVASVRPTAHYPADHQVRSAAAGTDGGPAVPSLPASRMEATAFLQKSPRQSAPCLPAAAIFPTITDIARFSINSTGHPPLAVPFLVARPQAVDAGIRGRQLFGSVPQPSASLSSIVLPAGFMAPGTALRLPVAPMQQQAAVGVVTSARSDVVRSPISSQLTVTTADDSLTTTARADQADHHDVLSPVNWKLKMARDHVSSSEVTLHLEFPMIVIISFLHYHIRAIN